MSCGRKAISANVLKVLKNNAYMPGPYQYLHIHCQNAKPEMTTEATIMPCCSCFGFLEHPFKSFTSAAITFLALTVLFSAILVLATSYYNSVFRLPRSDCHCHHEYESSSGLLRLESSSLASHTPSIAELLSEATILLSLHRSATKHRLQAQRVKRLRAGEHLASGEYTKVVSRSAGQLQG